MYFKSYQLNIDLARDIEVGIGKLGIYNFPRGKYIYTGSAKKNIDSRLKRHLAKKKNLHWHIDYLLDHDRSKIVKIIKSELDECQLNKNTIGKFIVKGFGSSDCRKNCLSHLKLISET